MGEPFWMGEILLGKPPPSGWRDEHGRSETIPCARCWRITPLLDPRAEVMRLLKLSPYEETSYVNRCGHKVDYITGPRSDGGCQLIPIVGKAIRLLSLQ